MENPSPEWIQAYCAVASLFVSIAGTALVLRTINQQKEVNKAQFDLLAIESKRAAREARPVLTLTYLERGKRRIDYLEHSVSIYELKCTQNIARNVCIEFLKVGTSMFSKNMHIGNIIGQLAVGTKEEILVQHTAMMDNKSIIRIHYQDIDGRLNYDDFFLDSNAVGPMADKRHTGYPSVNKLASWINSQEQIGSLYPDPRK
jgi:hypothetical protein